MLRLIVSLLLLLNVVYFSWSQGWLLPYGWGPTQQREPQRVAQQIRPEALVILNRQEAASPPVPVTVAKVPGPVASLCLQTGELDTEQAQKVRGVLQGQWPDSAWVLDEVTAPERWMIYMGKYTSLADLQKKRAELAALKIKTESFSNPDFAPGLLLGSFGSEAAANEALQVLVGRGVRTAKVLQEPAAKPLYRLRLPALSAAQQLQLEPVKTALAGQTLEACTPSEP
jgi:hypothetical protein